MSWLSLNLQIPETDADTLCDLFLGWGALSAGIEYPDQEEDLKKRLIGERNPLDRVLNEKCTVKVLLDQQIDIHALLHKLKEILRWRQVPRYSVEPVEEQDWIRVSRESILPVSIHDRLWIVPTWHSLPDPAARHLRLDPGTAFGTGRHPTTRLCLEWLVQEIRGGERVLDYGCGSGILAIAALKLGAGEAVGIDVDPQAIEVSAANARLNHVKLSLYSPEEIPNLEADLVVANLYANPLKEIAPRVAGYTKRGGKVVLSGILAHQIEEVTGAYMDGFEFLPPLMFKSWACLVGMKRGA